ncbi:hypothetical protein BUE80_DR008121 [Diplocarpon rosae]|nr:hypothetical protein BUE80_DR008121 [Diplocarpon rosae]
MKNLPAAKSRAEPAADTQSLEEDIPAPYWRRANIAPPQDPPNPGTKQSLVAITVVKGSSTKSFVLHRHFMCTLSPYFAERFNASVKDYAQRLFLQDTCRVAFGIFVRWAYSKKKRLPSSRKSHISPSTWIEVCLFAEQTRMFELQGEVVRVLKRSPGDLDLSKQELERICARTGDGSPFRKFLLESLADEKLEMIGLKRCMTESGEAKIVSADPQKIKKAHPFPSRIVRKYRPRPWQLFTLDMRQPRR